MMTKGEEKSLTWNYALTAVEQTKSQTFYLISWKKFNLSSSNYDLIGSKTFLRSNGRPFFIEPNAPDITINRNDQATLLINNVRTEDEGTFKIEYSLDTDGTILADHEVNVTVLGKLSYVRIFLRFNLISKFRGLNSGLAYVKKRSNEKSDFNNYVNCQMVLG